MYTGVVILLYVSINGTSPFYLNGGNSHWPFKWLSETYESKQYFVAFHIFFYLKKRAIVISNRTGDQSPFTQTQGLILTFLTISMEKT